MKKRCISLVGIIGTAAWLVLFFRRPTFPNPDILIILFAFVFMIFNQAWDMLKSLGPFVAILIIYSSFRSIIPSLNEHVHYLFMPHFDTALFGKLPTIVLQNWLWQGRVVWYDYSFYTFYMLHFMLPLGLALVIYKLKPASYWRYAWSFIFVSFSAFVVFLLFPSAPPWMASEHNLIPHITRISSAIYSAMGIQNFPTLYAQFVPNPVAAFPSLHTSFSVLFSLFVFKLFGKKWGIISLTYPIMIIIGVIYMGEHYAADVIAGALLALLSFVVVPKLLKLFIPLYHMLVVKILPKKIKNSINPSR